MLYFCLYLFIFIVVSYCSKGIGSCWIGLDDKQKEGTFVWQDTTILQPSEIDWITGMLG